MPISKSAPVDWESLLAGLSRGKTIVEYSTDQHIFDQGQPADSLFFVRNGRVKLSVLAQQRKETILATMSAGEFFGEGCLADQPLRLSTASTITDCSLIRIEKLLMMRALHENHQISELFIAYLLLRNIQYKANLVDLLFNLSEQPLARFLLLLAQLDKDSRFEPVLPGVSQDSLTQMFGTTPSRIGSYRN
jgi:CRP/FNR family transcriptional regulator, cyclic AMP receptor protein